MSNFSLDWNELEVQRAVDMTCEAVVYEGAEDVLKEAKRFCPVGDEIRSGSFGWKRSQPGSLRNSGRIVRFKANGAVGAYVKFGGRGYMVGVVDTYYACFVELGTPGTSYKTKGRSGIRNPVDAKPFLRPALRKNKVKILAKFQGAMK